MLTSSPALCYARRLRTSSPFISPAHHTALQRSHRCEKDAGARGARRHQRKWPGPPTWTLLGGGLLQTTRIARALLPVTQPPTNTSGSSSSSSSNSATPFFAPLASVHGRPLSSSETTPPSSVIHVHPHRLPTDLLDDMPVYKPDDSNGPYLTTLNSYYHMHSLPGALAYRFYFRHTTGADAVDGRAAGETTQQLRQDQGGRGESRAGRRRETPDGRWTCRLCREEISTDYSMRLHITLASIGNRTCHPVREVALDTIALLGVRGYPVDDIMTVWAETLFRCPDFPRLRHLSDPRWTIEKRAEALGNVLFALRQCGIIDVSLERQLTESVAQPGNDGKLLRRRRIGFERLEYIGDNFWSVNLSKRLVQLYPDQRWLRGEHSLSFNAIRDACEMNTNLDFVFDTLRIADLLSTTEHLGVKKMKADLVEAILGELHMHAEAYEPRLTDSEAYVEVNGVREAQVCAVVQHCLSELYDLVVLQHARDLAATAIPLAKELVARRLWLPVRPFLLLTKRTQRLVERGPVQRSSSSGSSSSNAETGGMRAPSTSLRPPIGTKVEDATNFFTLLPSPGTEMAAIEEMGDLSPSSFQSTAHPGTDADSENNTDCAATPAAEEDASDLSDASAALTAWQRSNARVLPGLPRLFDSPRVPPRIIPHPLRHLPPSDIPAATYCEHTRDEVLEPLMASYRRLKLISDDAGQTRYVVDRRPPQWSDLISSLAPQVVSYNSPTETHVLGSSQDSGVSEEGEGEYDEESHAGMVDDSEVDGAAGTRSTALSPVFGELQSGEVTRRLLASMEEGNIFCRDVFYNLAASPQPETQTGTSPAATTTTTTSALEWVLHNSGLPTLTPKPTDAVDGSNGKGVADGGVFASFAESHFIPPNTRPPPAGVVTERNVCKGVFAYLAFGEADPVGRARQSLSEGSRAADAAAPSQAEEDGGEEERAKWVEEAVAYWKRRPFRMTDDASLVAS